MKKIIFLDIDGVLTVPSSKYCLDRERMKLLGEILDRTGAWIVVSSSWRAGTIKDTIFNLTNPDDPAVGSNPFPYCDKIIGVTPVISWQPGYAGMQRPPCRGEEIAAYLRLHPCDSYVILDDEDDMQPSQSSRFILLVHEDGLTLEVVERAVEILNNFEIS